MAKPNYRFDKRQRELAKQKKKEEKRLKKEPRKAEEAATSGGEPPVPAGPAEGQDGGA